MPQGPRKSALILLRRGVGVISREAPHEVAPRTHREDPGLVGGRHGALRCRHRPKLLSDFRRALRVIGAPKGLSALPKVSPVYAGTPASVTAEP